MSKQDERPELPCGDMKNAAPEVEPSEGRQLCQAFADTFDGGGWVDAPEWSDFDEGQHHRWARAAERYAEISPAVARLREEAEDARTTLAAWFDLAKLIEEDAAPVVLAGLRGYLRTAKNGGMPSKDAELAEAVLADYCRIYLGQALVPVLRGIADTLHGARPPEHEQGECRTAGSGTT